MSAILPGAPGVSIIDGSLGPDGVRRYKTRCKILIDSHNAGSGQSDTRTLTIQDDVFSVEMSKNIKGPGQATIGLIPSINYLNRIFPNDYINVYFDIGDGSGWTRTFFGFVDRIEESYSVSANGAPSTTFRLVCTDFYKAFDRTQIYFNPQLANRPDFSSFDFAEANIGGLSLMTRGIVAGGSPPDVITNLILLLIGFGTQFKLPPSYRPGSTQKRLREARARLVYGKLSPEALKELKNVGYNYQQLRSNATDDARDIVKKFNTGKIQVESERIQLLSKTLNVPVGQLQSQDEDKLVRVLSDLIIREQLTPSEDERSLTGGRDSLTEGNINLLDSTTADVSFLNDVFDVFTFVERRSIDGYFFGYPVWQQQGSLVQILRAFSNEAINEMFFDLRPLSSSGANNDVSSEPVEGAYARIADDKEGNIDKDGNAPPGVTYIPALVMREYPFGTIEGLNLDEVQLELLNDEDKPDYIGALFFGAIFSDKAGTPGRHVIEHDNINVADKAEGRSTVKGKKHLDVAVISEKEVQKTVLGRSDNDHFNLFEFFSDDVLGSDNKFYLKDMLPVITPIHIVRNGIRVHTVTTRAARFSVDTIVDTKPPKVHPADEGGEDPDNLSTVSLIQSPIFPADPDRIRYYNNNDQASWGYRPKPKPPPADQGSGPQAWVFHQGIDITRRPVASIPSPLNPYDPIPIKAIADGWVVGSFPDGCYTGYGNTVVIKHKLQIPGESEPIIRYSVYAHLDSRAAGTLLSNKSASTKSRKIYATPECPGASGGIQKPKFIRRGDLVGYMGNSGFKSSKWGRFHLHFEICRDWPPKNNAVTPRKPFTSDPQGGPRPSAPAGFDETGADQAKMLSANQNSCDPYQFFQKFGINLQTVINSASPAEDPGESEPADSDEGDGSPEELGNLPKMDVKQDNPDSEFASDEAPATSEGARPVVDGSDSRKQIIRWALLQDHWYQHNLEYLSGTVQMRGAPEIRVGYRLDMSERRMSYYVEGVNHSWKFPNNMSTTLKVTRGQPNNPFPIYVYPHYKQMRAPESQRRTPESRLATYFVTPDPVAIRRSIFLRGGSTTEGGGDSSLLGTGENTINFTDQIDAIEFQEDSRISTKYKEMVSPAGSSELTKRMETDSLEENTGTNEKSRGDQLSGADPRTFDKENPTEDK